MQPIQSSDCVDTDGRLFVFAGQEVFFFLFYLSRI